MSNGLPKRLIEVDLPIKRISEHGRRERNIRSGNIASLHMWWARRPLAACRAVICAALWPDPADPACPDEFRIAARAVMNDWATDNLKLLHTESAERFLQFKNDPKKLDDNTELRKALLDFIADFSDWDNADKPEYLKASRKITIVAHEALGGASGTRPTVIDPFAGGGAIPLEALRLDTEPFASDLNPIPVLLNKVLLEYVPAHGERYAEAVTKWGAWLIQEANRELGEYYPAESKGLRPIAYLWARTIQCEGPACGVEIPLMNKTVISKRRRVGAVLSVKQKRIAIEIRQGTDLKGDGKGTVQNGKVTCPACGYTMLADSYRQRAAEGKLGERMYCAILANGDGDRVYRNPSPADERAFAKAKDALSDLLREKRNGDLKFTLPDEMLSTTEPRRLNVLQYGFTRWEELFNARQQFSALTFSELLHKAFNKISVEERDDQFAKAVATLLALCVSNILQYNCNMSTWLSDGMISVFIQSSSIPMRADYAEASPLTPSLVGGLEFQLGRAVEAIRQLSHSLPSHGGTVALGSASNHFLPNDSVDAFVTDPPYYFAIPYAELSDFFYVWLRRFLADIHPDLFQTATTPKQEEAIQNLTHSKAVGQKDRAHFETKIFESLKSARDELKPEGIGIVVFAHASTEGWEALLSALLKADWVVTGSWPIDTEREGRMLASRQRSLASSVHLVCRPRKFGAEQASRVGDWRDVLHELPRRIHDWMPRLAEEGIVGADAIFACLGPALEVFSRYPRVEKANGDEVSLKEYLTHVWAAVAKEALQMVFAGADTSGFEEDARLTAIWLWTLSASQTSSPEEESPSEEEDEEKKQLGYSLEFDAARKIAQGLGAHLESLASIVEIKPETARLLSVTERTVKLFGRSEEEGQKAKRKKKEPQLSFGFIEELERAEESGGWGKKGVPEIGSTVLDRVHQSMILFAAGRSEALKRFLVDEGVGSDERFWRLAQVLSYLYLKVSDEKRWIDGVLARKKGLGF